ncbi:hypothetical protein NDI56_18730 [Haloarcula sp. S1CR25-12]|uniref:Glycosyltransferase RgtA/B/C/D-like domain-containing protein n=1 Tax=Haloarcula saliterrae TaxID=2950534 RepID=A0ABU2FI83_9EURY|nr:hypothetical protein [Haloarcula sp. S1CR25-12]MDS0261441.1 hypothetical protein [Haloarcula sp. S1CR25-12]
MAIAAVLNPATGYELSIYAGTPVVFWAGLAVAVCVGIGGATSLRKRSTQYLSAAIAIGAIMLFVSLPFVRDYYYFGQEDALQHLGWVREILLTGSFNADPYPGIHVLATFLNLVTGVSPSRSLLLVPPATFLLYVVSLPLLADYFVDTERANLRPLALLSGCLIPTITAVMIPRMQPIATVGAMHITPIVIWATLNAISSNRSQYTSFFICIVVLQGSLVLYHPQYMLVLLAITSVYTLGIVASDIVSKGSKIRPHPRYLIPGVVIPGVVLSYDLIKSQFFSGASETLLTRYGSGGISTADPSGSGLSEVGGSALTLFVRSLSVKLAIGLVGVLTVAISIYKIGRALWHGSSIIDEISAAHGRQLLLLLGCVPVAGLGLVYLVAGDLPQVVRYFSFITGLGTVFVSIRLVDISGKVDRQTFGAIASVLLIVGVAGAVPATFNSPYLFKPTQQVTESQMSGYDWTFNTAADKPTFATDTDVGRHYRATRGNSRYRKWRGSDMSQGFSVRGGGLVGPHFNSQNLSEAAGSEGIYLITTDFSRQQQLSLYKGLVFNESDYRYLQSSENISCIYDNGDFREYQVRN